MGGRRGAHGCVFHGRKARGVATNVYLRKTSKKLERCGLRTLSVKHSQPKHTCAWCTSVFRLRMFPHILVSKERRKRNILFYCRSCVIGKITWMRMKCTPFEYNGACDVRSWGQFYVRGMWEFWLYVLRCLWRRGHVLNHCDNGWERVSVCALASSRFLWTAVIVCLDGKI